MTEQQRSVEDLASDWAYENADKYFRCSSLSCGSSGAERAAHQAFLAGYEAGLKGNRPVTLKADKDNQGAT